MSACMRVIQPSWHSLTTASSMGVRACLVCVCEQQGLAVADRRTVGGAPCALPPAGHRYDAIASPLHSYPRAYLSPLGMER